MSDLRRALAEPGGWKLVPLVPTPEMERAAFDVLEVGPTPTETGTQMRNKVYRAMLAASPAPQPAGRALTDEQAKVLARVGPVHAPDGEVRRTAIQYRIELEEHRLAGIRIAERAHGIGEGE